MAPSQFGLFARSGVEDDEPGSGPGGAAAAAAAGEGTGARAGAGPLDSPTPGRADMPDLQFHVQVCLLVRHRL